MHEHTFLLSWERDLDLNIMTLSQGHDTPIV